MLTLALMLTLTHAALPAPVPHALGREEAVAVLAEEAEAGHKAAVHERKEEEDVPAEAREGPREDDEAAVLAVVHEHGVVLRRPDVHVRERDDRRRRPRPPPRR